MLITFGSLSGSYLFSGITKLLVDLVDRDRLAGA
jgi:hypothetical protein